MPIGKTTALDKPVPARRGYPVRLELPDQSEVTIEPVSVEQVRRCLRLDPAEGHRESDREYIERIVAQFRVLVGPEHAHLVNVLSLQSVQEIVQFLYIAGSGMDPQAFALYQATERKGRAARTTLDILQGIDAATLELAADLRLRPADVAAMPLADCAALRQQIARTLTEERRFAASLHNKELK